MQWPKVPWYLPAAKIETRVNSGMNEYRIVIRYMWPFRWRQYSRSFSSVGALLQSIAVYSRTMKPWVLAALKRSGLTGTTYRSSDDPEYPSILKSKDFTNE